MSDELHRFTIHEDMDGFEMTMDGRQLNGVRGVKYESYTGRHPVVTVELLAGAVDINASGAEEEDEPEIPICKNPPGRV